MNRSEHERLVAEVSEDASDDSAWEEDPSPAAVHQPRLGAQVTIRLEPELAKALRRIAEEQGVRYTALVRQWLEERLREEAAMSLPASQFEIAVAGYTDSTAASGGQTVTGHLGGHARFVLVESP